MVGRFRMSRDQESMGFWANGQGLIDIAQSLGFSGLGIGRNRMTWGLCFL